MSQTSKHDLTADLLTVYLQHLLVRWGREQPLRTGLHASAVLVPEQDWCVRRQVLSASLADPLPVGTTWHTNALFLHGWTLHEKWQQLFTRFAHVVEIESAHYDEMHHLHFTPDAVIAFAGERYIVEIKGYHAEHYLSLHAPPKAAVQQANLYMHLLGISRAIVLVENKNTQEFKLWVIHYDPDVAKPFLERIAAVKAATARAAAGHSLPARVCASRQDALAMRCPVRDVCFAQP